MLGILVAGVVLGFFAQWIVIRSDAAYAQRLVVAESQGSVSELLGTLDEMLRDGDLPVEELLDALAALGRPRQTPDARDIASLIRAFGMQIPSEEVASRLAASPLPVDTKLIAVELWQSLANNQVTEALSELAARVPTVRYANHAVGALLEIQGFDARAAAAFEREGKLPEAKESRQRAIHIYVTSNDLGALSRLADDPLYASDLPAYARMKIASEKKDWWDCWWLVPVNERERFRIGPAALALFTGCCWFAFNLQAGQAGTARGARSWMCALAVLLGALSIWPTHMLDMWQEQRWGLVASEELTAGIRFFVLSVGFREELSKLLLFLPLVPLILRRDFELETLIVAACVGLGFAVVENSHYFRGGFGSSSVGRFLTANFFHMASTGLVGLAVVRGIRHPRTRGPEALAMFGVIVLAHGLYDAMMVVPSLAEYSFVSMIIFIFLAYQFFHELREMRIERNDTVSLTANFLCGVSLVTAVTFVYMSGQLACAVAAMLLVPEILSVVLMVYMFLREMPGSLVLR